jgi:hypothetical protein
MRLIVLAANWPLSTETQWGIAIVVGTIWLGSVVGEYEKAVWCRHEEIIRRLNQICERPSRSRR